ncbi:MAG TPA: hypothetical protein VHG32_01585 [Thermoanaerobaculia bacterium]|jgi:hypothetical protein|nr:hypothetical protein [Thermoanaerobaculia bacterium]
MQPQGAGAGSAARTGWERAAPWALALVAAGTALAVLSRQVLSPLDPAGKSDFMQHAAFARTLCQGGGMPPHFLFELVVCGIAAPLGGGHAFELASVAVASLAVVAKVVLTYRRIREAGDVGTASLAALGLLFAMPIFNWWKFPQVYLGQISPNVWHNPTAIAVLPLAMLLFSTASQMTTADPPRRLAGAGALTLLNGLTKPNYLLALLPCWVALLVERAIRSRREGHLWWRRPAIVVAAVAAPAAGLLAWQAWRLRAGGAGIAIAPLAVWRLHSPNIPASILLSLAFPLGVLALNWKVARRQAPLVLAWSVLLVAMLQMALLAERGARWTHGNFFWGAYAANYLLFVESAVLLAGAPQTARTAVAWGLLAAHAAAGVVYVWLGVTG